MCQQRKHAFPVGQNVPMRGWAATAGWTPHRYPPRVFCQVGISRGGTKSADQKGHQARGGSQRAENGGRLSPPPPHPCPLHHFQRTLNRKGSPPPPTCLCGSPGNTFEMFFLFLHALPFIFGTVGAPPRHILKQDDPRGSLRTHPKPYNMSAADVKKGRNRHN
jgi:hypothetical protein